MPFKSSRPVLVLVAMLGALAVAPGSSSAPTAGTAGVSDVAKSYLSANAASLGVASADVADVFSTSVVKTAQGGLTHVNLNQRFGGLEVFGGHVTVTLNAAGKVVFAGGNLSELRAASPADANLGAADAVEAAAEALELEAPTDLSVIRSSAVETTLSDGGISEAPIPARLGWQPTENGLRLAWQLVIDDSSDVSHWRAVVDARTGKLLEADDWTSHDTIDQLAERLARPVSRVPFANGAGPTLSPTRAIDGSSYLILPPPTESPNDDGQQIVQNPADTFSSPLGWHDTNNVPGPEFTITRGNNAHAYLDQDSNNAPDFNGNPDGGPALQFHFPWDLTQHSQNYRNAVVTNLFYNNSWMHDVLARYGFDEAADNFQAINYGAGSPAGNGDYVRAEAADGSGTNNANFNTPSAGGSPRMQMFLWPGAQFGAQNQVVVDGVGSFDAGWSRFGAAPTRAGTSGTFYDAVNGCAAADYAAMAPGSIAVATGNNTGCQNVDKTRRAGEAGAAAIVLHSGTTLATLTGSQTTFVPNIAVVSVTAASGTAIRNAIAAGTTTGTVRHNPNHPGILDGDLDNGIIFHEYGHGVSNRLTGGPGINCLGGNEQAGEGWSDYLAITQLMDPAIDHPDQPRGLVPYVLFQPDRHGNGLRPRPYTTDMTIQPFTYDSIKTGGWLNGTSLALPHGLGHGWASVLWDLNWALVDTHGFNYQLFGGWSGGGNTRALQYVMNGMKLQGCNPGLVVASRAIVQAANLLGGGTLPDDVAGDACIAWSAFARRGLGYSAIQGTTNRDDNTEAFDTHPNCLRGFLAPIKQTYGELNEVIAGDAVPLRFQASAYTGLEGVLARKSPYSRQVDCATLKPVQLDPPRLTPKAAPEATTPPGKSGLSRTTAGTYHYNWKTDAAWAGTCRELVLTRTDGKQHRAFFRLTAPTS